MITPIEVATLAPELVPSGYEHEFSLLKTSWVCFYIKWMV
jgi:hypothetical protein